MGFGLLGEDYKFINLKKKGIVLADNNLLEH